MEETIFGKVLRKGKEYGNSVARGVPQMATGFVDLFGAPLTMSGLVKPEQVFGSTDYFTSKGLLPPKQEGLDNETTELLSSVLSPSGAAKGAIGGLAALAGLGIKNVNKKPITDILRAEPQKTVKGYKLFNTKSGDQTKLYPLYVNADKEVPIGQWIDAESGELTKNGKVKSSLGELAYRPGWHAGDMPVATHIGGKSDPSLKAPDYRKPEQVWAEVEMPADVDWQSVANKNGINAKGKLVSGKAHITDQLPAGGHYRYKTNPNMTGEWLIGGSMKVNKLLTPEEVMAINEANGVFDLPRFTPFSKKDSVGRDASGLDGVGKPDTNLTDLVAPSAAPELTGRKLDAALRKNGVPIANGDEAESLWSQGKNIYAFHELDEAPFLVKDRETLAAYTPDQLLMLPSSGPTVDPKSLLMKEYDVPATGPVTGPEKSNMTRINNAWAKSAALRGREGLRTTGETRITDDFELPSRKILTPEDLYGKVGVQVQGDRTAAGRTLHSVGGVNLDEAVPLQGGPNYGLIHSAQGSDAAWASELSAATGKHNQFKRVADETGSAPLGIYSAMSLNDGANFSHHLVEAMVRQLRELNLPKKTITEINKDVKDTGGIERFVGLDSPSLIEQLRGVGDFNRSEAGNIRKAVVAALRKPGFQMKGAPHFGDAVRAVTEPDLYNANNLDSGYSIFKSAPERDVMRNVNDGMDHLTYSTRIPGEYMGGLQDSLPVNVMFPKLTKKILDAGYREDQLPYLMGRDRQGYEKFDQEWLDGVMKYLSSRGQ